MMFEAVRSALCSEDSGPMIRITKADGMFGAEQSLIYFHAD